MFKKILSVSVAIVIIIGFQNCQKKVEFQQMEESSQASQAAASEPQQPPAEIEILKNKSFLIYGTRINGQLALVAQINSATTIPLKITLTKSCGSIDDMQISGNGTPGKFEFLIPAGSKDSNPVILSNFPSGQIVWKVNIVSQITGIVVTDVVQTCSPWLQSGGAPLCPAPNNQPYCVDRG